MTSPPLVTRVAPPLLARCFQGGGSPGAQRKREERTGTQGSAKSIRASEHRFLRSLRSQSPPPSLRGCSCCPRMAAACSSPCASSCSPGPRPLTLTEQRVPEPAAEPESSRFSSPLSSVSLTSSTGPEVSRKALLGHRHVSQCQLRLRVKGESKAQIERERENSLQPTACLSFCFWQELPSPLRCLAGNLRNASGPDEPSLAEPLPVLALSASTGAEAFWSSPHELCRKRAFQHRASRSPGMQGLAALHRDFSRIKPAKPNWSRPSFRRCARLHLSHNPTLKRAKPNGSRPSFRRCARLHLSHNPILKRAKPNWSRPRFRRCARLCGPLQDQFHNSHSVLESHRVMSACSLHTILALAAGLGGGWRGHTRRPRGGMRDGAGPGSPDLLCFLSHSEALIAGLLGWMGLRYELQAEPVDLCAPSEICAAEAGGPGGGVAAGAGDGPRAPRGAAAGAAVVCTLNLFASWPLGLSASGHRAPLALASAASAPLPGDPDPAFKARQTWLWRFQVLLERLVSAASAASALATAAAKERTLSIRSGRCHGNAGGRNWPRCGQFLFCLFFVSFSDHRSGKVICAEATGPTSLRVSSEPGVGGAQASQAVPGARSADPFPAGFRTFTL